MFEFRFCAGRRLRVEVLRVEALRFAPHSLVRSVAPEPGTCDDGWIKSANISCLPYVLFIGIVCSFAQEDG